VPTQVLWGRDDRYLDVSLAAASAAFCDDATVRLLDATHWVVHERPAAVVRSLEQHIAAVD
jgi:pimeloyl-ACP methyl ester carboxylesterase